jgi:hypothetical protein
MKILILFIFFIVNNLLISQVFENIEDYGKITNPDLNEISGLAPSLKNNNILWVHNDSGNESFIYGISKNGELKAVIKLIGATFEDPEDIALGIGPIPGKYYIYLGDFGDNNAVREVKYIYRFEEPSVKSQTGIDTIIISNYDKISFNYDDGKRDAESMVIDPIDSNIVVFSKREKNVSAYIYPINSDFSKNVIFKKTSTLPFGGEGFNGSGVTASDFSLDGKELLIKTYSKLYYYSRDNNESLSKMLSKSPIEAYYIQEPQGEAICWEIDKSGYFTTSESTQLGITPHLYHYSKIKTAISEKKKEEIILMNNNSINFLNPIKDFRLFNLSGKQVYFCKCEDLEINLDFFPSGIYFYSFYFENKFYSDLMIIY